MTDETAITTESMCLDENIDVGENIDDEDAFSIPVTLLTSDDVNNMSLAIWKDIKLIQDSLEAVMSKVVKTFGILDTLVKSRKVENNESKLYSPTIKQLELQLKFNEEKHRKEVDSIKATWQKDIRELNDSMELVLEDNQRLALMLTEHIEEPMYNETYEVGNSKDERIGQMGSNCNELNNYLESESFQTEMHNENINVQANDTNKIWSDNFPHFQNLNQHSGSNDREPFSTSSADTSTQSKMNGLHREHKFVVVPGKTLHNPAKLHDNHGYSYKVTKFTGSGLIKWKCMCKRTMCKAVVYEHDRVYKFGNCKHNHKAVPRNKQAIIAQIKRSQTKKVKIRRQLQRLKEIERSLDPEVFANLHLDYPGS